MRLLVIALLLLAGCSTTDQVKSALDNAGVTPLSIGGTADAGDCAAGYRGTTFSAIDAAGTEVQGVVCQPVTP